MWSALVPKFTRNCHWPVAPLAADHPRTSRNRSEMMLASLEPGASVSVDARRYDVRKHQRFSVSERCPHGGAGLTDQLLRSSACVYVPIGKQGATAADFALASAVKH